MPVRKDRAHIYVCGITAYDYCHIGHARSAVVFDVLVRHLRNSGLEVLHIRNFTDIDDKIIRRANEEHRDWKEVAETYIRAFHEDMDRLDVLRPDLEPKATENISSIITMCEKLIASGKAYKTASGDVYFRVKEDKNYGKLSHRSLDEMLAGARVAPGEEKEYPLDFALWKSAKPGEPFWKSPWGKGRPGWHIECSAMTQPYLPLDIHGGGQDLIFPHHENEIAQSEAICGCQLAKYWMHNGFVQIDSEKMSKSLGNFTTIREILKSFLPETLRFFLLTKHYRSPIDFTRERMEEAEKAQKKIYAALADVEEALKRTNWKNTPLPENLLQEWTTLPTKFEEALEDDLNTGKALGFIFTQARIVNRLLEDANLKKSKGAGTIFEDFLASARNWQKQLGLFSHSPGEFLEKLRNMRAARLNMDVPKVEKLLSERAKAREKKDFSASDAIRDELASLGIAVRDTPGGQIWDID